jgi:Ala-tRNA(Pro) deacylase
VADSEWYGCTDGTTTCYLRISTRDLLERFLPTVPFPLTLI